MTTTPETPRTDAKASTQVKGNVISLEYVHVSFARQLERELAASEAALAQMTADAVALKAEVERLTKEGTGVLYQDCCDRRKKAEAACRRAIQIAEEALEGACGGYQCIGGRTDEADELRAELDALKATLNSTDK